jgi:hypothetical protein
MIVENNPRISLFFLFTKKERQSDSSHLDHSRLKPESGVPGDPLSFQVNAWRKLRPGKGEEVVSFVHRDADLAQARAHRGLILVGLHAHFYAFPAQGLRQGHCYGSDEALAWAVKHGDLNVPLREAVVGKCAVVVVQAPPSDKQALVFHVDPRVNFHQGFDLDD